MPSLRIRKSCAALAEKFSGKLKRGTAQPAANPEHTPPMPGLKLLYLAAWKKGIVSYTMGYHVGLVLIDFAAPTAVTPASGFYCIKMHAMTTVSQTRNGDMAGAIYLGQVPQAVDIKAIKGWIPQGADLENTDTLDRFIDVLYNQKLLIRYMNGSGDDPENLSGTLKLACDRDCLALDEEGWPIGVFKGGNTLFHSKALPIFDLHGEVITDRSFSHIPALTPA